MRALHAFHWCGICAKQRVRRQLVLENIVKSRPQRDAEFPSHLTCSTSSPHNHAFGNIQLPLAECSVIGPTYEWYCLCVNGTEYATTLLDSRATVMVVRGPYTAIPAAASSRPVMPTSLLPGHTPKMVPTAKLVSMMDDPSRGSNATEYPCTGNTTVSKRFEKNYKLDELPQEFSVGFNYTVVVHSKDAGAQGKRNIAVPAYTSMTTGKKRSSTCTSIHCPHRRQRTRYQYHNGIIFSYYYCCNVLDSTLCTACTVVYYEL